jgi:hypothetical protein
MSDGEPADWERRHRVYPPDAPPVPGVTYRCVRCDREDVGRYPRGECVIPGRESQQILQLQADMAGAAARLAAATYGGPAVEVPDLRERAEAGLRQLLRERDATMSEGQDDQPAYILRRASALMRERAKAAAGPWEERVLLASADLLDGMANGLDVYWAKVPEYALPEPYRQALALGRAYLADEPEPGTSMVCRCGASFTWGEDSPCGHHKWDEAGAHTRVIPPG